MIDENEFFREATSRINGSLDTAEAMHSALQFLRKQMPVDRMFLQYYEADLSSMRTVAIASQEEGTTVDLPVPLSAEAHQEMWRSAKEFLQQLGSGNKNFVWLFQDKLYDWAMNREFFGFHRSKITSLIVMPLTLGAQVKGKEVVGNGSLFLVTEGEDKFTQRHADLVSLLKEPFAIAMANARRYREVLKLKEMLADDNRQLHREMMSISGDEIIGAEFGLREVMEKVSKVAPTESPVLLMGETGVGKDVIANAIHLASPRHDGPFIPVNCGAIPESLIDSELFGHEKGAFTGALAMKRGRFERADKGTILLDEIGEMPLEVQVRLLRVLQHREVERVGGTKQVPVDIRIIAATNKNLTEMVEAGSFREDLYFRLNVFPIVVPPLRDRTSDIPVLVQHFIERKARELKFTETPPLAPGEIDVLTAYHWPGNVRELENVVERAMIMHRDEPLRFDELAPSLEGTVGAAPANPATAADSQSLDLDAATARHIRRVLEMSGGKIHGPGGAGELLGVNPNTLRYRMKKLGIQSGRNHA